MIKYVKLIAIILFLSWLGFSFIFNDKIYPNVYVAGIHVGGKNKTEAVDILQKSVILPEKIVIKLKEVKSELLTTEIVNTINYSKTVERAYNYRKPSVILAPKSLGLDIEINEKNLLEALLIISEKAGSKSILPSVKIINGQVSVDKGADGVVVDIDKLRSEIGQSLAKLATDEIEVNLKDEKVALTTIEVESFKERAQKLVGKKIELKLDYDLFTISDNELVSFLTPTGFNDELIRTKILDISRQLNRSPQDSVFIVVDGKVEEFTPSKDGIVVDEDLLLNQIKDLPVEINIPVIKTSPKINNSDVNNFGIDTLIGVGFSNFKGSIPNRIHNVNLAQSKFKGVLIPPKETVSFNEVLGDVSAFTGYKSAYVIMDGKTVLGDGGGVCQVSTTLFRAVLSAGLPIVERRAHAYRVGYYEQGFSPGLDATVYSPTTDFKFRNDTEAYILLQPSIDLDNLTLKFEIYGTSDGRVATTSKPVITSSSAPAGDVYQDDPTMPAGHVKQIEHRAYGARVVFDYKVTRNGEELINQKFVSNYRPWQAVYLRGTSQ